MSNYVKHIGIGSVEQSWINKGSNFFDCKEELEEVFGETNAGRNDELLR